MTFPPKSGQIDILGHKQQNHLDTKGLLVIYCGIQGEILMDPWVI